MGRIGKAVAHRLHFGWRMPILYTSRSDKPDIDESMQARRVDLETLLRSSDFVSLHTSLQPETRGMIGSEQLAWMKPTSVLVNTSRGEIVDQDALFEALRLRTFFGAGLDVTSPEPLPEGSPLRNLDNCLILPHIGSATFDARRRMSNMAANNLIAAIQGHAMPYPVPLP
jgi:lactate dehydrogenase-like 2-hydroxyacid dehydrogenase